MRLLTIICASIAVTLAGCSSTPLAARQNGFNGGVVDGPRGFIRLPGAAPKDIQFAIAQLMISERWQQVPNNQPNGFSPQFTRNCDMFEDASGNDITIDWVCEDGRDAVVLVSAAPIVQERITGAVGVNIIRHQKGLSPISG